MLELQTAASEKLGDLDRQVRDLRSERSRARGVADQAREAVKATPEGSDVSEAVFATAKQANAAVRDLDQKIEELSAQQVDVLKSAGRPLGLHGAGSGDGWALAAQTLSIARGNLRVDTSAQSLLQGAVPPPPSTPSGPTVPIPVSNRWVWPSFSTLQFGPPGDMASSDFRATFLADELTGGVGNVERDVDATTEKAELTSTIELVTVGAKQFAVIASGIPQRVLESQDALASLLSGEIGHQLGEEYDRHVVAAIEASNPPSGSTGTGLVEQIRNAIADARDLGSEPTVLALTPADAAALDLTQDGESHFIFATRVAGEGSPVWSLQVRESPSINAPTLIDPGRLGVSYLGGAAVDADPYTGLGTNQVRIRAEVEAKFHIRNSLQGAWVIA